MDKYKWEKMEGRDILKAFEDDPQAIDLCQWDMISDFAWNVILQNKPELASKCKWEKLPAWNQFRNYRPRNRH